MNGAPRSGLGVIVNGGSTTFQFEGDHNISTSFSISKNGVPLLTVLPTGITLGVSLNNISVQQLNYLLNITSDVETLNNSITTNVESTMH